MLNPRIPIEQWVTLYQAGALTVEKDGDDVTLTVNRYHQYTGEVIEVIEDKFTVQQLDGLISSYENEKDKVQTKIDKLTTIRNHLDTL